MGALAVENDRLFEFLADLRAAQLRAVAIGIGASLVLGALLALGFTRNIAVPFESLTAAAAKIAGGELGTRMHLRGHLLQTREARQLTADFNAMAAALHGYERERNAMIADIAHELRTPLATLQMRLDALHDGLVPFDAAEASLLLERTSFLARMVDDLRLLSLADGGRLSLRLEAIELGAYLRGVEDALRDVAVRDGARLVMSLPDEPLLVRADADRLFQILRNLVENAAAAMKEPGGVAEPHRNVVVRAQRDGVLASITVRDHGPGIDPRNSRASCSTSRTAAAPTPGSPGAAGWASPSWARSPHSTAAP